MTEIDLPAMLRITDDFAAAPHPAAEDFPALAAAGFRSVICNRPDDEVAPDLRTARMAAAARAAGLDFALVAVPHGPIPAPLLEAERRALIDLPGPHFAYCAAGIRATVIWALACAGHRPTADIVQAVRDAGLDMPGLAQCIRAERERTRS